MALLPGGLPTLTAQYVLKDVILVAAATLGARLVTTTGTQWSSHDHRSDRMVGQSAGAPAGWLGRRRRSSMSRSSPVSKVFLAVIGDERGKDGRRPGRRRHCDGPVRTTMSNHFLQVPPR
ncbi:MAG: hypothetical protein ACRCYU_13155 [Nocardioides sp.]